jgi:hypothetical protein
MSLARLSYKFPATQFTDFGLAAEHFNRFAVFHSSLKILRPFCAFFVTCGFALNFDFYSANQKKSVILVPDTIHETNGGQ